MLTIYVIFYVTVWPKVKMVIDNPVVSTDSR